MSFLNFSYNQNKDIFNYLTSIYKFDHLKHGRNNIENFISKEIFPEDINNIKNAKDENEAKNIIQNILRKRYLKNKDVFLENVLLLKKLWGKREKYFLKNLNKFFKRKNEIQKINVYFTTLPICPYSFKEKWFTVSLKESLFGQIHTIYHELFHFVFIYFYSNYCRDKELPWELFEDLKESFTVFLNYEFKNTSTIYESGYPAHKELRDLLINEYNKNKDLNKTVDLGIEFLKNKKSD